MDKSRLLRLTNNSLIINILLFSVLAALSYYMVVSYEHFFAGDDFSFHYRRMLVLVDSLNKGNFPVYIDPDAFYGYGYLSNLFYSDVMFLPFAAIGCYIGAYEAFSVMVFTMSLLCGLITYWCVKSVSKNRYTAAIASLIYTFCLYRLHDCYFRTAVGEYISFSFLPIVFLGIYHIVVGDYTKKWYIIAIGFTLLLYTHVLTAILSFIFVIIFLAIGFRSIKNEPKRLVYLVVAGVCAVLMSAYFLFPFVEQLFSSDFYFNHPSDNPNLHRYTFISLAEALTAALVDKASTTNFPKIGLLLTMCVFMRFFVKKDKENRLLKYADIMLIIGLVFVISVTTPFSWRRFPLKLLAFIQFPWRMFEFISFFFAVSGAYYLSLLTLSKKTKVAISVLFVAFTFAIITNNAEWFNNQRKTSERTVYQPTYENHELGGGKEYLPQKARFTYLETKTDRNVLSLKSNEVVAKPQRDGYHTWFEVETTGGDVLEVPIIYYKGYEASVNGKKTEIEMSDNGLIKMTMDKPGNVDIWYKGTAIQYISFYISIVCILVMCLFVCVPWLRKRLAFY